MDFLNFVILKLSKSREGGVGDEGGRGRGMMRREGERVEKEELRGGKEETVNRKKAMGW